MEIDFAETVEKIVEKDPRYARAAYYFLRMGLDHTVKKVKADPKRAANVQEGKENHVSGQELLEGIREFALEQYGPMAFTLLGNWGVRASANFGDIVFNLIDAKVFGKTENDSLEDFQNGFDFQEALVTPYLPESRKKSRLTKKKAAKEKAPKEKKNKE